MSTKSLVVSTLLIAMLLPGAFAHAQSTDRFTYAFPKFTSDPGTDLVIGNFNADFVAVDIDFFREDGSRALVYTVSIPSGVQARLTPASLNMTNFVGAVFMRSNAPIAVTQTIVVDPVLGLYESVGAAEGGATVLVPFGPGESGIFELSLFNPSNGDLGTIVSFMGSDGIAIGSSEFTIPPRGSVHRKYDRSDSSDLPVSTFLVPRDVAYLSVRTRSSILSGDRPIHAMAVTSRFSARNERIHTFVEDPSAVNGLATASATNSVTLPIFIEAGPTVSLITVVDASNTENEVVLTARGADGAVIPGRNPMTVRLRPGGALVANALNLFRFNSPSQMGFVTVSGSAGLMASAALADVARTGFTVIPPGLAPGSSFVFHNRQNTRNFYTGLAFRNDGAVESNVTLWFDDDRGNTISRTTFTVGPRINLLRTLAEIFPEGQGDGYVLISSDRPIAVTALEGRNDGTMLAALPLHVTPTNYRPRPQSTFLVSGTIRSGTSALSGIAVLLTGPVSGSVVTDPAGAFFFPDTPPGNYSVSPVTPGYVFSPSQRSFSIRTDNSRGNDFTATLIRPVISGVTPSAVVAGSGPADIVVTGGPFIATSQIVLDGFALPTTFIDSQTITTQLDTQRTSVGRNASLFVRNTGPSGDSVTSAVRNFPIGSKAPVLSLISGMPIPLVAGHSGFLLTVTGTGFVPGATVEVEGVIRSATYVDATTLRAQVFAQDLGRGGAIRVTATNPSPTVGPSNVVPMPVLNPIPGILSISPNVTETRLEINALPLTIGVNGFSFVPGARVQVGSELVPTEFLDSNNLLAMVPSTSLQIGGSVQVTVQNPAPAMASSESIPLLVNNLPPVLTAVEAGPLTYDPSRPTEKYQAFVTLTGQNFGPNTVVEYLQPCPGVSTFAVITATRLSSSQIVATTFVECTGTYQIRVKTPQPGGGGSNVLSYVVNSISQQGTPNVAALSPNSIRAGSPTFTLTITGNGFQTGAFVNFGTAVILPQNVATNAIVVTIPAFLIQAPGTVPVSVTNADATGSSNRVFFTIQ